MNKIDPRIVAGINPAQESILDQMALQKYYVNVKEFGAKGDGIADDTKAIQDAVSACYGKTLSFPDGIFLTDGIVVSGDTDLLMSSGTTLKKRGVATTDLIYVKDTISFKLTNGVLEGKSSVSSNVLKLENVGSLNIETTIKNSGRNGMEIIRCSKGKVLADISETKLSGVRATDTSNLKVDVTIDGVDGSGVLISPETRDVTNVQVQGTIKNCARTISTAIGVYFNSGDVFVVKNSKISAQVYNAGHIGIFPGGDHNKCVDCHVDGSGLFNPVGAHSYRIHDSSNITLINCTATASERAGFEVAKAHLVVFESCKAYKNKQHGFWFLYDNNNTGRYRGDATNKDITLNSCQSNDNGLSAANTYQGYFIDGARNILFGNSRAHDYQDIKTQQRGIRANTNAFTSNISILNCDFRGNISNIGILVDESYLSHSSFVDGEGTKVGYFGKTPKLKSGTYTTMNYTADRYFDATSTNTTELANVLATLINDLKTYGLIN